MLRSSPSVPECFSAHYFFPCCPLKCNYCGGCHQVGRGSKYINKYIVVEKKWGEKQEKERRVVERRKDKEKWQQRGIRGEMREG